jgi:DNA-binding MarR family transcriptional regulator
VTKPPPARAVAGAFLELAPQLIRLLSSTLDAQPGITLRQFRVLQQVVNKPWRARDLANSTGVTAPTMSAALANLEARGLVARTPDPDDGRAALVIITDAGREAVEHTSNALMAVLEGIAADVEPKDAEAANRICAVLLAGVARLLPGGDVNSKLAS